ncbi:MAG: hypothetical protein H0X02_12695 [Nitrosomonas sp.]|nr:hypothetical protein [Nitrosomonas sp.]
MARLSPGVVISILLYIVFVVFLVIAIWAERQDIRCSQFNGGTCGAGNGSAYADGKPSKHDNLETLLKKARFTAHYELNSITWRRAFIPALLSAFLVLYVTKKRLPHGLHLATAFLITYIIFYLTLTMFQGWVSQPALKQLDQILHKIADKQ